MKNFLFILFSFLVVSAFSQPCSLSLSSNPASCWGMNDGAANATATGTGTITYDWMPGTPAGDGTSAITGLTAGTYSCTITDINGCTTTSTVAVTEPQFLDTINVIIQGAHCPGYNNGSITINGSGGTPPYTYSWQSSSSTSNTLSNLTPGFQAFTITDAAGCQRSLSLLVIQDDSLDVVLGYNGQNYCAGQNNVIAWAAPMGAVFPVTYQWSNGSTQYQAFFLSGGTYTCTITDAAGCHDSATIVIPAPPPLSLVIDSIVTPSSCTAADGGIYLHANGGTPGYQYIWDNNSSNQNHTGLADGLYSCTILDTNNCVTYFDTILNDPNAPTVSFVSTIQPVFPFCTPLSGGSPAGGYWIGPGVSANGTIYCTTADSGGVAGNSLITYVFSDSMGCTAYATDTIYWIFPFSNGPELTEGTLRFYPNPANDVLTVESEIPGTLDIFNARGMLLRRIITKDKHTQIQVQEFPEGLYFFTLSGQAGQTSSGKFIVRH